MSTTKKVAHNTLVQIVGKIISVGLGLVALGMMTRYLGTEQFGWYTTAITFLGFAGILIDFGLIPVTAQMMSEPKFDKTKLFQNLMTYRFVTAIIFFALMPFVVLFFPYPPEVKMAVAFMTISFLGVSMNQVLVGFFQTKLQMHVQVASEVIGRVMLVIGTWLFIYLGHEFLSLMVVVTAAGIAYTIALWIAAAKRTTTRFRFDRDVWKAITVKMWPIAISIVFNVVYLKGDILLLSLFREQSEVGLYGAAYRVIDILAQMAMMIMGVMLPLMAYAWSRKNKHNFKKFFQQSFDIMMMLAVPMVVGALALADDIVLLVAGPEFIESATILRILILAVFGVYLGAVFGHAAVAIDKQKQTMWIYISVAILTLIGYLIFIPSHGMYGAAWMTVFSELVAGVLLFFTIRHYSKETLQTKTFGLIIFSSLVMGAGLLIFSDLHLLLAVPLGVLIYGGFLYGLGAISKETVREILSLKK